MKRGGAPNGGVDEAVAHVELVGRAQVDYHLGAGLLKHRRQALDRLARKGDVVEVEAVLFQYSIDPSSGLPIVVAEDAAQPFLSSNRP